MLEHSRNAPNQPLPPAGTLPARTMAALLSRLPARCLAGQLSLQLPTGQTLECRSDARGPHAYVTVHRWRGLMRLVFGGNLGFARAYLDSDLSCADLEGLFEWALANESVMDGAAPTSTVRRLIGRWQHKRNANTVRGSRRNIAAHYDLGNAFYETWLDRGMSYSSAIFANNPGLSLEDAQNAKLDRIEALMDLKGGERILEIGCGWGGLAERLVGNAGHFHGVTLSEQQHAYARQRIAPAIAARRADICLQDYRHVEGSFDRIASIEMLEAVGERYWPAYFDIVRERLAPGGVAVLQVITIREDRFADYARDPDFIQSYIFPGGMLPTVPIISEQVRRAGLVLEHKEMFADCYARTLAEWRKRFLAAWPQLTQMGFDERFRRMWTYYLTFCEVGFKAGEVDVGLYRIVKPPA